MHPKNLVERRPAFPRPPIHACREVKRVRKAIELAFSRISSNEADIRALFQRIDLDGGGKVSYFESAKEREGGRMRTTPKQLDVIICCSVEARTG